MKKAYRTTKFGIVSSRLYRDERDPAFELPEVTEADAGKVLAVGEDGQWGAATAPDPLPEVTSADAGKVLTVSDAGAWEAAAASGGGNDIKTYKIFVAELANNAKNGIGHMGDISASTGAYDDYMIDVLSGKQINIVLSRGNYNNGPFNVKYDGQYTGTAYGTIYDGNSILYASEISIAGRLSTEIEKARCATFANIKKFTMEAPW